MNTRPINCRDDEVWAFINGDKSQLRRPITPIFSDAFPGAPLFKVDGGIHISLNDDTAFSSAFPKHCPLGAVGDRLWVREAWNMRGAMFGKAAGDAKYASKKAFHYRATDDGKWRPEWGGWRSSSQMPRMVSRLTLEIVKVRVERLQSITEKDACAEGVSEHFEVDAANFIHGRKVVSTYKLGFKHTWDKRYNDGPGLYNKTKPQKAFAWCNNPLVWVVEVKVIK